MLKKLCPNCKAELNNQSFDMETRAYGTEEQSYLEITVTIVCLECNKEFRGCFDQDLFEQSNFEV